MTDDSDSVRSNEKLSWLEGEDLLALVAGSHPFKKPFVAMPRSGARIEGILRLAPINLRTEDREDCGDVSPRKC